MTGREQEIISLIARGAGPTEMFYSAHTARDHVKAIFRKVGVSSRGELVARLFAEHYGPEHHGNLVRIYSTDPGGDRPTPNLPDATDRPSPASFLYPPPKREKCAPGPGDGRARNIRGAGEVFLCAGHNQLPLQTGEGFSYHMKNGFQRPKLLRHIVHRGFSAPGPAAQAAFLRDTRRALSRDEGGPVM
jgi:DNA-binding CsgD family transcriptional regulator